MVDYDASGNLGAGKGVQRDLAAGDVGGLAGVLAGQLAGVITPNPNTTTRPSAPP